MAITRRRLLAGGAGLTAVTVLGAAFRPEDIADWTDRPRVAWAASRRRPMPAPSPERHLLSRASFGQAPGEVTRVAAMGLGAWVEELGSCWQHLRRSATRPIQVDLDGVMFVDAAGKSVLRTMRADGARLTATTLVMRAVVDEITASDDHCGA